MSNLDFDHNCRACGLVMVYPAPLYGPLVCLWCSSHKRRPACWWISYNGWQDERLRNAAAQLRAREDRLGRMV